MAHHVPDEDIDLFARGLYRSKGDAARAFALARARGLRSVGDEAGHSAWKAVADRIRHIRAVPVERQD